MDTNQSASATVAEGASVMRIHSDAEISEEAKNYHRLIYPKGEVVLKLENLTKKFGERTSVNGVSLEIKSGEVFGFLGPNGAGKTTTIRMIAGLAGITAGEAYVCGHSVKTEFKAAVRNIGGIIENPEMYKYMTGWDNLRYYADLYGGISDEQIMDVVRLVKMEKRIREKVRRYSLGMRQRVGIAQSLLHNPRLLILDEPTNGLDPAGIHEMRDFLKMLAHDFGIAVFISSHILTEMQLMCDRVAIVSLGKLIAVKSIEEWTRAEGSTVKMTLLVSKPAEAAAVLNQKMGVDAQTNGKLIIFNVAQDQIGQISQVLAGKRIAILSMVQGEKSLEETFLELTSQAGTEIN
ncbi:MAG: ABC transporter ATP-binding protein [Clostridiales bacterium]|jgi:ABC-2 type transport system ATP-binding protein|nr:ABC transporter ATP-binding protein [Clostridiales bacterium]